MSELLKRARKLANEITQHSLDCLVDVCEQALLAERRLALEEAAKIAEEPIVRLEGARDRAKSAGRECVSSCRQSDIETRYAVAKALRAAAEKEVQR